VVDISLRGGVVVEELLKRWRGRGGGGGEGGLGEAFSVAINPSKCPLVWPFPPPPPALGNTGRAAATHMASVSLRGRKQMISSISLLEINVFVCLLVYLFQDDKEGACA